MSTRLKEFLSNFALFGVSSVIVKALAFFLLPLYTYFLTTDEYATIDLVNLSVSLALPVLTMAISDAVLRFGLDDDTQLDATAACGLVIVAGASCIAVPACVVVAQITSSAEIGIFSWLIFTLQNLNNYFVAYLKCIDRTRAIAVSTTLSGAASILLNVFLIAYVKMGIVGYWLATTAGLTVGVCVLLLSGGKHAVKQVKAFERETLIEMLSYSAPLIPNSIFWWINSSLDRFVLTAMTTLSLVGLYAAASKIPQVISTVGSMTLQAWNISVFQNWGDSETTRFFVRGYRAGAIILFAIASVAIVFDRQISSLLLAKDFYDAWPFVPLLVVGAYLNFLNSILGSAFTAAKSTGVIFSTTAIGAVVNVVGNVVFVLLFGGIGATLATMLSCLVVYAIRTVVISRRYSFLSIDNVLPILCITLLTVYSIETIAAVPMHIEIATWIASSAIVGAIAFWRKKNREARNA